jgi:hypothetical protein
MNATVLIERPGLRPLVSLEQHMSVDAGHCVLAHWFGIDEVDWSGGKA